MVLATTAGPGRVGSGETEGHQGGQQDGRCETKIHDGLLVYVLYKEN
jgi:hypothetical protein